MAAFVAENLAPIMFIGLVVLVMLFGYPVAFASPSTASYSASSARTRHALAEPVRRDAGPDLADDGQRDPARHPLFTFMGLILERSGMAEDLLDTIGQVFGPIRGGLAYAVIFVGALLAATTGVVAASVISMGLISLPIMLRYGYDRRDSLRGTIAASGTLAQIITAELVLIVLADQLKTGSTRSCRWATCMPEQLLPGLVLTGLFAGFIMLVSILKPDAVPPAPRRGP